MASLYIWIAIPILPALNISPALSLSSVRRSAAVRPSLQTVAGLTAGRSHSCALSAGWSRGGGGNAGWSDGTPSSSEDMVGQLLPLLWIFVFFCPVNILSHLFVCLAWRLGRRLIEAIWKAFVIIDVSALRAQRLHQH